MIDNIFLKNLPRIDLHGYDRESARILIEDFIKENLFFKNNKFIIIHGKGTGILKECVQRVLKKNRYVKQYKIDIYNEGCTIVWLKFD